MWQIQEQKLRYISQVMTHKAITRSCEDVDITVLNAAEVKAIATDNPLLLEKMTTENEVTRLTILRSAWQNEQANLGRKIETTYPQRIKLCEKMILNIEQDMETVKAGSRKDFLIELDGRKYDERTKAGKILLMLVNVFKNEVKSVTSDNPQEKKIGSFRGLDMYVDVTAFDTFITVKGSGSYSFSCGDSDIGNIARLENLIDGLKERRKEHETKKAETLAQLDNAKKEFGKPFQHEDELNEQSQRLIEINTKLEFKELTDQDALLDEENSKEGIDNSVEEMDTALVR